jgi:UDP-N-acetylmuramate dehydrogenase
MELRALIRYARTRGFPITVLGRGSDVVISDRGIRGLVVQDRAEGARIEGDRYVAEAGVPMARAATETQKAGLTGLEFGLAIPGSVGGAVWANAGAHESQIASILESADLILADGSEARLPAADLALTYRDSRLKHAAEWVLAATFRLEPADAEVIKGRLDDIRRWRQAHQPLGLPSAGSVFRNPADDSAGRLIDATGLKGTRIGGAVVSGKHANFIVNDQRGTAAEVRRLGDHVQAAVEAAHGVRLAYEIEFLGDWEGWPWPPSGSPDAPEPPQPPEVPGAPTT